MTTVPSMEPSPVSKAVRLRVMEFSEDGLLIPLWAVSETTWRVFIPEYSEKDWLAIKQNEPDQLDIAVHPESMTIRFRKHKPGNLFTDRGLESGVYVDMRFDYRVG